MNDKWSAFVERCWPRYDTNGDGKLDRHEAMDFFRNTFSGCPASQFDSIFSMMDVDNNGTLDKLEMAQYMRDHCQ